MRKGKGSIELSLRVSVALRYNLLGFRVCSGSMCAKTLSASIYCCFSGFEFNSVFVNSIWF